VQQVQVVLAAVVKVNMLAQQLLRELPTWVVVAVAVAKLTHQQQVEAE
jgi:hypothetical protein